MSKIINVAILIVFNLLFLFGRVLAGDVSVTEIKVERAGDGASAYYVAEAVIDRGLKLSEIRVSKIGDRTYLKFPEYVSKRNRIYPQVSLLTKQANQVLLKAVETKKPVLSSEAKNELTFNITKFSIYRKPSKLKVFAAVTFNDAIEVECKILEGARGARVLWPSRKSKENNKWIMQAVIIDKRLREKIELELLAKYDAVVSEGETLSEHE